MPQPAESQVKGVTSTYYASFSVPVRVKIDGNDMIFKGTVITGAFPLGTQELRSGSIYKQQQTHERASLVVSFSYIAALLLKGPIDNGSGVSISIFFLLQQFVVQTSAIFRPYGVDFYAAKEQKQSKLLG